MKSIAYAVVLLAVLGCAKQEIGAPPDFGVLSFPLSMAVLGNTLYVVNTDFDMDYTDGWVSQLDLDKGKILPDSAIKVRPYGGDLLFSPDQKHAFLIQRWDSSIIGFDVTPKGLDCGQKPGGYCEDKHILYDKNYHNDELDTEEPGLGDGAFSACIENVGDTPVLFAVSITDGFLAAYDVSAGKPKYLNHIPLRPGVVTLACDGDHQRVYAGHSRANLVDQVDVRFSADKKLIMNRPLGFSAPMTGTNLDYFRQLRMSRGGNTLYATYRSPNTMLVFDTTGDPRFLSAIDLPPGPADFVTVNDPDYGDYAFVACGKDGSIAVVSMDTGQVVKRVRVCRDPYKLVRIPGKKRIAIACFRAGSIGLISWSGDPAMSLKEEDFIK